MHLAMQSRHMLRPSPHESNLWILMHLLLKKAKDRNPSCCGRRLPSQLHCIPPQAQSTLRIIPSRALLLASPFCRSGRAGPAAHLPQSQLVPAVQTGRGPGLHRLSRPSIPSACSPFVFTADAARPSRDARSRLHGASPLRGPCRDRSLRFRSGWQQA